MMASSPTTNTDVEPAAGAASVEAIQADIERQREELAGTVDALAAKLDVKSRAKQRLERTTQQVRSRTAEDWRAVRRTTLDESGRPTAPVIAAGAAIIVLGLGLWWRQSRR